MNENPLGPSTKALAWVKKNAATMMNTYQRESIDELRSAVAAKNGVPSTHVVIDSGSDEVVTAILKNLVGPKKNIVTPELDYFAYKDFCEELGVPMKKAALDSNLKADVDSILKTVDKDTGVVLLSNPANPTGAFLTGPELARLAGALNERGIKLVIDAAYREYAKDPMIADPLAIMRQFPNVAVLGTFSKAYGLAGMRVGYAIGSPEVVTKINPGIHPSTITTLSAHAAMEALKDERFLTRARTVNEQGKATLTEELTKLGMQVYPSQTSFVMVKTPIPGTKLAGLLAARGIMIRDMTGAYGLQNYIRISIGNSDQVQRLVLALKDMSSQGLLSP